MLLSTPRGRIAAKGAELTVGWGQGIVRRDMFSSELDELDRIALRAMPLLKTAFKGWKDFNRSRNWHKMVHAAKIYRIKGRFRGAGNDETPEMQQKSGHVGLR